MKHIKLFEQFINETSDGKQFKGDAYIVRYMSNTDIVSDPILTVKGKDGEAYLYRTKANAFFVADEDNNVIVDKVRSTPDMIRRNDLKELQKQLKDLGYNTNPTSGSWDKTYFESSINMDYGFYGNVRKKLGDDKALDLFDEGVLDFQKTYKVSELVALNILNSVAGSRSAEFIINGEAKTAMEAIEKQHESVDRDVAETLKTVKKDGIYSWAKY